MDPAVPLTLSPTLIVSRVKEALACGLIAIVVSTGCVLLDFLIDAVSLIMSGYSVYGITILQAYIYFQNSGKDSVSMRSFVRTPPRGCGETLIIFFFLEQVALLLYVCDRPQPPHYSRPTTASSTQFRWPWLLLQYLSMSFPISEKYGYSSPCLCKLTCSSLQCFPLMIFRYSSLVVRPLYLNGNHNRHLLIWPLGT